MRFFSRATTGLLVAVGSLWAAAPVTEAQPLSFDEAWVRAMPPGMKMTAAFGQLKNSGPDGLEIVDFGSPQFADVSLHRTEAVGGVSRMREVEGFSIEAGETVELQPGGLHLMLMGPAEELQVGQVVTVILSITDGRKFSFTLPVERR